MQKYFFAALVIGLVVGVGGPAWSPVSNAEAQDAAAINPQVAALLAQYPQGGPGLRAAVARLTEAEPSLAVAEVAAAAHAAPEQEAAIGAGLADAEADFTRLGPNGEAAADLITQAMKAADPATLAAFISLMQPNQAQVIPGSGNNVDNITDRCISPSTPDHLRGCR
jgi:hypothetical protein